MAVTFMPLSSAKSCQLSRLDLTGRFERLLERRAVLDQGADIACDRFEIALLRQHRVGPWHSFRPVAGNCALSFFVHQFRDQLQPSDDRAVERRNVSGEEQIA